ncbi:MAG TPA: DNA gyrase modulator [Jatrophihabitans sp.]|nr:DNA gyrase modulator [Jatrophihabitans sp.]
MNRAIPPQDTVERALHAAACDDCVVIVEEGSTANLRWAGNTLTTNGVSSSRRLTVIAVVRDAAGTRAGVVSRSGTSEDQIAEVVAEAERAAAASTPAQDAQPLPEPAYGDPF